MLILALDAAVGPCSVALWRDGRAVAERCSPARRGQAARLAPMVAEVLADMPQATRPDAVAVTIGPGSFTGLRAAIALAHGLALAFGVPVLGVGTAAALAAQVADRGGRTLWVALDSRRGCVFLGRLDEMVSTGLDTLPSAPGPLLLCGDAAEEVAARLAARGDDVRLSPARVPRARDVATLAARQLAGELPRLAAQPLYTDPPAAQLPAGGLRPAPV